MLIDYAARTFGLRPHDTPLPPAAELPLPAPGTITALVGPSGAGKTRALMALAERHPGARVVVRPENGSGIGIKAPEPDPFSLPVPMLLNGVPPDAALRILAACGLADGRLWSLRASQLSAGEQQRLWLARAIAEIGSGTVLIADEFDAHLDFDTARAIAQNLRRLAARQDLRVVVSTHRPEVLPWLGATRVLRLDGELCDLPMPAARDLGDEISIEPGRLRDWSAFSQWHYLGHGRPGPTAAVWLARLAGRPVGIALLGFPHLLLAARKSVLPAACEPRHVLQHGAAFLNANVRLLSRIVVDPRLRGCGVAGALLKHALPRLGVPIVECIAQMGEFTGFLQRAGFERAGSVQPPRAVLRLRGMLNHHGIHPCDLMDARARSKITRARGDLRTALDALLRSRIESGHGSLRDGRGDREAALRAALSRLHAEPGYFVWRRTGAGETVLPPNAFQPSVSLFPGP